MLYRTLTSLQNTTLFRQIVIKFLDLYTIHGELNGRNIFTQIIYTLLHPKTGYLLSIEVEKNMKSYTKLTASLLITLYIVLYKQ